MHPVKQVCARGWPVNIIGGKYKGATATIVEQTDTVCVVSLDSDRENFDWAGMQTRKPTIVTAVATPPPPGDNDLYGAGI